MKQNGAVNQPEPALLFFIFRFENLISGPKCYRDFRETGPRSLKKTKPCQLKKSSFPSVIHNKGTDLLFSDNAYTCKVA